MRDCTSDDAADCKMEKIVCITFILFWIVGCIVAAYCRKYIPLSKHRRDKEVRRRIELYKQQHLNVTYKDYECYYTNDKDYGYGTAEFYLAISPLASEGEDSNDDSRKRRITGCGIREGEYTEIIEGYVYEDGNAEFIEKTTREMKPNNDIKLHRGQASIKSVGRLLYEEVEEDVCNTFEGEYFVKDKCQCTE